MERRTVGNSKIQFKRRLRRKTASILIAPSHPGQDHHCPAAVVRDPITPDPLISADTRPLLPTHSCSATRQDNAAEKEKQPAGASGPDRSLKRLSPN